MVNPGPVLALDVGTRTIGVARTDASRRFVFVDPTLPRRSVARDTEALHAVVRAHGVTRIVVGLPVGEPGEPEPRGVRLARQIGEALAARTGLPVDWVDEGYTTVEAHARLRDAGLDGRARRGVIDGHAAAVILEQWLGSADGPDRSH